MQNNFLKSRCLYAVIAATLFSTHSVAQVTPVFEKSTKFVDYQKKMNAFYDAGGRKASGYTQWKRLEWYYSTRLDASGKLPEMQQLKQRAIQKTIERTSALKTKRPGQVAATEAVSGGWTQVGPTAVSSSNGGIGRVNRLAFDPGNANNIWAATSGGGLWKTVNGGTTWQPLTDGLPNSNLSGVAVNPLNTNVIYILTGDADGSSSAFKSCCSFSKTSTGVLKSTDGGITWNYTGLKWEEKSGYLGYKLIMHPSNFNVLLVATNKGIYRTTDGGATWSDTTLQGYGNDAVYDIKFMPNNPLVVYAGVHGGKLYRSLDGGVKWTKVFDSPDTYASRSSIAVTPADPAEVFVLIANSGESSTFTFGGIFYSANMGAPGSWVKRASQLPNVFSGNGTGLITKQETYNHSFAVNPFNNNTLVTGAISVFRSINGGATVSYIDNDNGKYHTDIHELAYGPSGTTLYAATDGGVYKSINDGITWSLISGNLAITQYYRISVANNTSLYILGGAQDNGTHLRNSILPTFNLVTGQDGTDNAISTTSPIVMYTSSNIGAFWESSDNGRSFNWFCSDDTLSDQNIKVDHFWVTNIEVSPINSNIIYMGHSSVIRGVKLGPIWTFSKIGMMGRSAVSGRSVLKVAPSNANIIYAGDNNYLGDGVQKLWRTVDGGINWDTLRVPYHSQAFTRLTVNPDDPEDIWLVYGGFTDGIKVFRSADAGNSWTNISGSLPNVPVNCIVYEDNNGNPNDALYIGTDIGVFYRNNTLGDWIPFSNGLPVIEVTDIKINKLAGLLRCGTYGRGIWESALYNSVCTTNLVFSTANHTHSKPMFYSVNNTITSAATIAGVGANIEYKAGQRITLNPGFNANASNGAKFIGYIGPCPGGGVPPVLLRSAFNGVTGYLKNE